jgi:arabinogalactan endo-1,4-beta-galactosidase
MILGIDPSTYLETSAENPHYFYQGKAVDPLSLFHDKNGVDVMRLRLWVDPYGPNGEPYHGGTNDWPNFLKLAKLGMGKGYHIMLDIQFSDFWCDPSKQTLPKAWRQLNFDQIVRKVYSYTKNTLQKCAKNHLDIAYVQLGNEITNGMLWPFGKLDDNPKGGVRLGYDNLSNILKAATKASKEILPQARTMIQLERSGLLKLHEEFFEEITKRGVEFDLIGLSYYPYWHGSFEMLWANVENLRLKFGKPIMIVETGYGFTMEDYVMNGNGGANLINETFVRDPKNHVYLPYPLSLQGQKLFVERLLKDAKEHGLLGVIYWEPLWLPLSGLEWASISGEEYINETSKPTANEWANQCLFDYQGNATPAFDVYKVSF